MLKTRNISLFNVELVIGNSENNCVFKSYRRFKLPPKETKAVFISVTIIVQITRLAFFLEGWVY